MTVQDNLYEETPIFLATEYHDFMLLLSFKGTALGVTIRTPTYKELQTCPHVTCSLAHEWDPQNVCVPNNSRTVEEETSSNIGAVMTGEVSPDLTNIDSDSDSVYQIYDISGMKSRIIGSVKVALIPSSNLSETNATVQDVPQAKTFQLKGRHSIVSPE